MQSHKQQKNTAREMVNASQMTYMRNANAEELMGVLMTQHKFN
jgi:hypothetical protein